MPSLQESQLSTHAVQAPAESKKYPVLHPFASHLATSVVHEIQLAAVQGLQTLAVESLNCPTSLHESQVLAAEHKHPVGHGLQSLLLSK